MVLHGDAPPCWPSGEMSTLRMADQGLIPAFLMDLFPVSFIQVT